MNRRGFIRNSAITSGGILIIPSLPSWYDKISDNRLVADSAKINRRWLTNLWNGRWISYPLGSLLDYGVYHFRRTFDMKNQPTKFLIHVSADNRYRLFVNGTEIGTGPARGDLNHWRFESYDIARHLHEGKNVLAAVVWNFSTYAPLAQISYKSGFIVQGNSSREEVVNTNQEWKVYKNKSYIPPTKPTPFTSVGPGVQIEGHKYPFGWTQANFNDRTWRSPKILGRGVPFGKFTGWDRMLIPRSIPFMERTLQRIKKVARTYNISADNKWLQGSSPIHIPAFKKVNLLLDQTFLTNAYPELVVSGGKGSVISVGYAEALINEKGEKGNRNHIEGKHLKSAFRDIFEPNGGNSKKFSTLWFRTYRYIELTIITKAEPLVIQDIYGYFTAYPFDAKASFKSNDPMLEKIWQTGWRTARLCAGETYYDCPYYEQLQYIGDTRIQALISLYVSGDDRLMKNAITQFYHSLLPLGLTQSRYPCSQPQIIPPFSLYWILMIHDFWMHRDDLGFIKPYLNAIRTVLYWFDQQMGENGLLGPMDWWNFVDWSFGPWNPQKPSGGVPEGGMEGNSSILTLLYAYALQKASELFEQFGDMPQRNKYLQLSKKLIENTHTLCWDAKKKLLADTPKKKSFSQHANILGILCGMFNETEQKEVMHNILNLENITQTTYYFKFYLFRALNKAGLGNKYLQQLGPWRDMLKLGLTTFAETPEPTRSDCHGWSAHPTYDLLATVCGIAPDAPGFRAVKIMPNPGNLTHINGKVPHAHGDIVVLFEFNAEKNLKGTITLPKDLSGRLIWNKKEIYLRGGKQLIDL